MALFGPKSKEYGDLNRKSIGELNTTVEEQEKELQTPFAGSDPGLVPTSDETTQAKYLRGDGQWGTPAGGGGGTEDYEDLANKPAVDGIELTKSTTAEDLGLAKTSDLPDMSEYAKKSEIPTVPTKTSDLQNDSGFLTSESDPTVPSWAKQQNPPTPETYSGSTPGLVPAAGSGNTGKYLKNDGSWDTPSGGGTTDYSDLTNKPAIDGTTLDKDSTAEGLGLAKSSDIPTVPSKVSELQNDSGFLTTETDPTVPSWAKQQNPPVPATFDGEHAGIVPLPAAGDSGKFLKADGSWDNPASGGGTGVVIPRVPVMTSNTTPSGEASASTTYTNQPAYKAFNGVAGDPWAMANGDSNPWLQYSFANPVKIESFGYDFYTVPDRVTSFSLYGDENLIMTVEGPFTTGFHKINIPSNKQGSYSSYKISFVATGLVHVDTFQLYSQENISNPNMYSTNEQVIGQWIDGKPIYQKTFSVNATLDGASWTWYDTGITASDYNIESIIDGELLTVNGLPHCALGWDLTYLNGHISFISYWPGINITTMTLRYTKSTD